MNKKVGRPVGSCTGNTKTHLAITVDSDIAEWLRRAIPGSKSHYINELLKQNMKEKEGR